MDLKELKEYLEVLSNNLENEDKVILNSRLRSLITAFPFNEYEYMLIFLKDRKVINFADYEKLRNDYIIDKKYLDLYGLAPRIFGEIWGHGHIIDLDNRFKKPNKVLDPSFKGQYDLLINNIKIEVKAARAINEKIRGNLVTKALKFKSDEPFWMNFQQIKLNTCDVFIFVGVWVDTITYWILSNNEIKINAHLSHQHRGGIEYQIGITNKNINDFDIFKVSPHKIGDKVIRKARFKADNR